MAKRMEIDFWAFFTKPARSRDRAHGQGVRGQNTPEAEMFCHWNTQTRGKSCYFRIQLVSITYCLLSRRIWTILVTRLGACRCPALLGHDVGLPP